MPNKSVTGRDAEEYIELYKQRRGAKDSAINRMRDAQAVINNDIDLAIHELGRSEKPAVANLAQQGHRQLAQRIASVEPMLYFPSLAPGTEDHAADDRGRVARGWQAENDLRLKNAQRARHLLVFACMPVIIKPNPAKNIPCWYVHHPLNTFPSDGDFFDFVPDNVIFTGERTFAWFLTRYPEAATELGKPTNWDYVNPDMNAKFLVMEYMDEKECTLIAVGQDQDPSDPMAHAPRSIVLTSAVNYAGITPACIPGAINIDKQIGHFDGILGIYQSQAVLVALTMDATRQSIYPPAWAESNPGEQVDIVTTPDPYSYTPGKVNGGRITYQKIDPSISGLNLADRLEYYARMTAGLPSEFGGESPTNVRTGRRAAQVIGNTIDFTISESQDIFSKSTKHELEIAIEIDRAYFNSTKKYFVMTRSYKGVVEYKPSKLWVKGSHKVWVDYPMGGVDLQNLPIEAGQRVSMGEMSLRRMRQIDPAIPDADAEEHDILVENIDKAFMQSILTQASDPMAQAFQPQDMAMLKRLVKQGKSLEEAVMAVHEKAQERQSTMTDPNAPTAQPGLAQPGMGAEQPVPPQGGNDLAGMAQLLGQLGTVQVAQKSRSGTGSV